MSSVTTKLADLINPQVMADMISAKIQNKIVIGAGHSGASLSSQSWLNGSWEEKNNKYSRNIEGLNNLIKDFGTVIRSEINPQYPNIIYDGGELGYALATAYGYAIDAADICIPCNLHNPI